MEKIWLQNYPKSVPKTIDPKQYTSLTDMLIKSFAEFALQKAFSNLGTSLTYAELDQRSKAFGAYLQHQLGLKKGDRIAIMMPNLLQYPVAMFGALRAGLIVVNINPLYTAKELIHLLNDSGAKTIVILENFASTLEKALPQSEVKNIIVTRVGDLYPQPKAMIVNFIVKYIKKMVPTWQLPAVIQFKDVLQQGDRLQFNAAQLSHNDIAYLQYTGGTTGVAKGTILSHGNVVANILQLGAWVKPSIKEGLSEVVVTALPLYHIFSLTVNCLTYTMLGAHNVLITNPRDISLFIKLIKNLKFTAITGVNTLYNAMLNHPNFKDCDFSNLHFTIAGGMALQQSVAERWHETTGCPIVEGYGLTEASPVVTANPLDIESYNGTIGLPLPATDISIRDEENNELAIGEPGELCVKGPQVMTGYWQAEEQTKMAFTEDGWLKTGDIATINEQGYLSIVDRKKDMIIVSGFNVYPNEVEDAIARHPKVSEVAVVGVPDVQSGEKVKAFIVKKVNDLTEKEVQEFCNESLTRYKIPKEIEFRDELPKTPIGKILRRELRE